MTSKEEEAMFKKPGAMALAAIKQRKELTSPFKVPNTPPLRKRKSNVLKEEVYIKEIGKIIERDFFPDLEMIKAQNDFLRAVENNDILQMQRIHSTYSLQFTQATNSGACDLGSFDTPSSTPDRSEDWECDAGHPKKVEKVLKNSKINLDAFLKAHTTDDNDSFEEIIKMEQAKFVAKHSWMFQKDERLPVGDLPVLAAIKDAPKDRPNSVETWSYRNKNYIMYIPEGVDYTLEEKIEMVRNKQKISHTNTRLSNSFKESCDPKQSGVDQPPPPVPQPPVDFVQTPSPAPGVAESPLMTWGQIEGTPFRLDAGDTPMRCAGSVFKICEPTQREKIAHKLYESVSKKKSEAKQRRISNSPRISNSDVMSGLHSMSPAARKLVYSKLPLNSPLRDTYYVKNVKKGSNSSTPAATPLSKPTTPCLTPTTDMTQTASEDLTKKKLLETTDAKIMKIGGDAYFPKASDFF